MKKLLLKELKDLEDEYISGFKVLDFAVKLLSVQSKLPFLLSSSLISLKPRR